MVKGLYISKGQLEAVLKAHCNLKSIELVNPQQGFHKYNIEKEGLKFDLAVYYTKKGTTTVTPNCDNGKELEQAIINSIEYKNVSSGSFSTIIPQEFYESMITFLGELPSVTVSDPEDKGNNGTIYRVKTDFGDSVTLTYFKTTGRLLYQGLLMKLYSVIKSYLVTLGNKITNTELSEQILEDKVQEHINSYFPQGWTSLEPAMQGLIRDSFTLFEANTKLSDYAALVMPVIRVLEYRIKKVCLDYRVIIDDKKGFKYYISSSRPRAVDWVFEMDFVSDTVTGVNPNISMPTKAAETIVDCYEFLRKNRHEMFHATQILAGIRLVETKEAALQLIIETSEKIEESLTYSFSSIN